jgi:hypothetical protein
MVDYKVLRLDALAWLGPRPAEKPSKPGSSYFSNSDEIRRWEAIHAALAEPKVAVVPTDEELQKLASVFFTRTEFHFADFAHAVLARWGCQ